MGLVSGCWVRSRKIHEDVQNCLDHISYHSPRRNLYCLYAQELIGTRRTYVQQHNRFALLNSVFHKPGKHTLSVNAVTTSQTKH